AAVAETRGHETPARAGRDASRPPCRLAVQTGSFLDRIDRVLRYALVARCNERGTGAFEERPPRAYPSLLSVCVNRRPDWVARASGPWSVGSRNCQPSTRSKSSREDPVARGEGGRVAAEVGRALAGPGRALAGPGRALAGPGRALAGPGRALAGPGRALAGPGRAPTGPGRAPTGPGRAPMEPGRALAGPG